MKARLRQLRRKKELSQERVASQLGVSQQTISRYEKDIYAVPSDMLVRFAKYYDVSTDYLLGVTDQKRKIRFEKIKDSEIEEVFAMYVRLKNEERRLIRELIRTIVEEK